MLLSQFNHQRDPTTFKVFASKH